MQRQRMKLPPDVANGLLLTLMKDIKPSVPRTTVSMVATTPKPRLVKLAILPQGEEPFTIGRFRHTAMRYVVKVEIGGLTGFLARLMGKQPADTHVWVLGGEPPAFVKAEGPLYVGGPIWRIQLASAGIFQRGLYSSDAPDLIERGGIFQRGGVAEFFADVGGADDASHHFGVSRFRNVWHEKYVARRERFPEIARDVPF